MRSQKHVLNALVFVAGMTTLAVEMAAARLLAPWFGDSLPIWASLIGLILVYLSLGYWLGGRLADRSPRPATLYRICVWAGFLIGLIPVASRPVLRLASVGFTRLDLRRGGNGLAGTAILRINSDMSIMSAGKVSGLCQQVHLLHSFDLAFQQVFATMWDTKVQFSFLNGV